MIGLGWVFQIDRQTDGQMEVAKGHTTGDIWKNTSLDSIRETEITVTLLRQCKHHPDQTCGLCLDESPDAGWTDA